MSWSVSLSSSQKTPGDQVAAVTQAVEAALGAALDALHAQGLDAASLYVVADPVTIDLLAPHTLAPPQGG